jgi:uncharacterized protein
LATTALVTRWVRAEGAEVDIRCLAELCEQYGIAELSVFGSVSRGTATSSSDTDLLHVMSPGRRLGFAINRLEDELAARFDRTVDLVSNRSLHRLLRVRVLAEAQTRYAA